MTRLLTVVAVALATATSPGVARAEVVDSSEAGFVSRSSVTVKADPAATWRALIAPAGWWNGEHTYSGDANNLYIDAQATGCFCEKLPLTKDAPPNARGGSVEHMHIVYAAPARVLRMKGGLGPLQSEAVDATLTITLKAVPEGTRVLWEYVVGGYMRQKPAEIGPLVDKVLGEQLSRFEAKLGAAGETSAEKPETGDDKE